MTPEQEAATCQRYIGDGVYVSFDGHQLWLELGGLAGGQTKIALEPSVYRSLINYVEGINSAFGVEHF